MKRFIALILSVIFICGLTACGNSTKESSDTDNKDTEKKQIEEENTNKETEVKTAVIYFSGSGNTKAVAELIAHETGAEIYEIVPAQKYTDKDLNYNDDNCRANIEMNDKSARPEIKNDLSSIKEYDVIYLGYPIWWGTAPRIIQTFLESYDISKAKIYTFCTSGGSGIEKSISDLKTAYSNINIIDGKRLNNATKSDIKEWVEKHTS